MANPNQYRRPGFIGGLSHAYSKRGKSVVLLTGDTLDIFWSKRVDRFVPLEQTLYQELAPSFEVVRVDAATGISFYDHRDEAELLRICELADATASKKQRLGDVEALLDASRHQPLPTLLVLEQLTDAFTRARHAPSANINPLCVIMQFAGSLFPAGDFDRLSELDRQRLVTFLNWISNPVFVQSFNLIILVSDTKTEINARILALPSTQHIEVELPSKVGRRHFVDHFVKRHPGVAFSTSREAFVEDTAGLKLTSVEDLLQIAARTGEPVTRQAVLSEVNGVLEAELGDIVKVVIPEHGPEDVIGHPKISDIFTGIFRRCEDPETAISAVLVSGPNGAGKTYLLEAFAAASGRIVIELTGLRGMYFGQTDKFFELLRWHISTYGKILILVDEAHTAFGSVHRRDTHQTEQRLAGNIIKMMGNPRFLGKVVWGLMTSRPDELDPDVKSRAPLQVPIFDPEGESRRSFVYQMFLRKGIDLSDVDLDGVIAKTEEYSARDYNFLVREAKAAKQPIQKVLDNWQASSSIVDERRMQTLIAALHCSYPKLLPLRLAEMKQKQVQQEVDRLKQLLGR